MTDRRKARLGRNVGFQKPFLAPKDWFPNISDLVVNSVCRIGVDSIWNLVASDESSSLLGMNEARRWTKLVQVYRVDLDGDHGVHM